MRKRACITGVVAASAGLLMAGTPAIADSADNDGVNVGNDNNVSVLPVQACGNNVAVLGAVVPLLSPQSNECVNAPIVDHPSVKPEKPKPEKPEKPEKPGHDHEKPEKPGHDHEKPEKPGHDHEKPEKPGHDHEKPEKPGHDHGKPEKPGHDHVPAPGGDVQPEELPAAPTPVAVAGHHAVTG
ncbi:hypothetical protein [Parasphingorhabdus pacifica]